MESIQKHTAFVKAQLDYYTSQDERQTKAGRHSSFKKIIPEYQALLSFLETLEDVAPGKIQSTSSYSNTKFKIENEADNDLLMDLLNNPESLTPRVISSLSDEVAKEISLSDLDKFEAAVVNLINSTPNKQMAMNNLLVALKITTGETYSRSQLTSRLYRLTTKNRIFSVPGKKGVYSTEQDVTEGNEYDPSEF